MFVDLLFLIVFQKAGVPTAFRGGLKEVHCTGIRRKRSNLAIDTGIKIYLEVENEIP